MAICLLLLSLCTPIPATAELRFREVAQSWGIDFRHHHGGSGERYMPESLVGGVVVLDYDGDGDSDLFFVDGGVLPGYQGPTPRSRLFRNDGGRFVDRTAESGIEVAGYGAGGTAGDIDGDGDLDLYITAYGANELWVNDGDGTFHDGTHRAGVGDPRWSMSATFFDADRDGDLDLYVTNYLAFRPQDNEFCGDRERRIRTYCTPQQYPPVADNFYRNRGDGTFEEAAQAVGLAVAPAAGLGVIALDVDGDRWLDLYVANDLDPNYLFRNRGDGTFEDQTLVSGAAYNDQGRAEAGMGVDAGDLTGDGLPELVVTNFEFQTNGLYRNLGACLFLDSRYVAGIAEPSNRQLGFGVVFGDLDHDADLDLVVANGHLSDNIEQLIAGATYRQPYQLFENLGTGRFRLRGAESGLSGEHSTRALIDADLDLDGDLDLVAVNSNDRAEVYENVGADGRWLQVTAASASGDTVGIGARVEAWPLGVPLQRQMRLVTAGRSYLAQGPLAVHFGFGAAEAGSLAVSIEWPSGTTRRLVGLAADRRIRVTQ